MRNGIRTRLSRFDFDETVARLEALLKEKGIKLFCSINHSGEATAAGFEMPRTKVLIFGNAKAGTPLMAGTPSVALDLPLKLLVAETVEGGVMLPGTILCGCSSATGSGRSWRLISRLPRSWRGW